jgi:hypothetical protein
MDLGWHTHEAAKMQAALWALEATAGMQSEGQTAHGADLHIFRGHVWRGSVEDTTKAVKDKMSAVVKKALRSILAHPDCSSDVLWGHWATRCTCDAASCAGSTGQNMEAMADVGRCDSHSRCWCRPA